MDAAVSEPQGEVTSLISLAHLRKSFGETVVLDDISLSVSQGEVLALIGPSGSGKSTLLRCINLLEVPDSGTLVLDGEQIRYSFTGSAWRTARELARFRASVGMVFQDFNLWPHKTVLENITEAPIRVRRIKPAIAREHASELLEMIGLPEKSDSFPRQLSGGQQQRVAIARALAMEPKLMLFDEVTSALDPELVGEVLDIMGELARSGMTMIVVTHEMGFARHVSHRTAFLYNGRIVEIGPSPDILGNPGNSHTRQFLNRVLHHH